MILPIQLMASIVSLGVAFFFPALSHVPLLFPMTILILFWIGMRDYKAQPPDGLSTASLALFTRYPQYRFVVEQKETFALP